MIDTKRLISEVAIRNGFRIDERDPAFCVVTLSELVLEEAAKRIADDIRLAAGEFERAAEKVQARAGTVLAQQINEILVAARLRLDAEVQAAATQSRNKVMSLHQFQMKFAAHWITVGLAASAIVLGIGILVGMALR
jgi:CHASE3 domain sensor protein